MDRDFIAELPTVFNILKFNPEAIVDDTAIERLLTWLEEAAQQKKPQLLEKSYDLFSSSEIWEHSLTLSFALRFLGFLGSQYAQSHSPIVTVVDTTLKDVQTHKLFNEASVQYAFYKCLASLSSELLWWSFLKNCLDTMMESFKKSYLYVKKSAVSFFSSYVRALVVNKSDLLPFVHQLVDDLTDSEQLHHITESIYELSKTDKETALIFLSQSHILTSLMSLVRVNDCSNRAQLLESLHTMFSMISSAEIQFNWNGILGENGEEHLIDFIKELRKCPELNMLMPSVCESLVSVNHNFLPSWNFTLLQLTLSDISAYDDELSTAVDLGGDTTRLNVKEWKKLFVVTIGEMIKIERKIHADPVVKPLMKLWQKFCLKVLNISLSNNVTGQVVNEYLISVMYDKKIPRLCFQYLKESSSAIIDEELTNVFLECLWSCLTCHTDNPQVVCATLELLNSYISSNENNLTKLIHHNNSSMPGSSLSNADPLTCSIQYNLSDVFNKLLWDTNWEIQDSLIDVLLQLLTNAKSGSHVCLRFLEENTFWVKVIDLIDNQESYVRSKTVTFIGAIVTYQPLWEIFCLKHDYQMVDLLQLLKEKFLCEKRQDDMFTRRSIVEALKTWISAKLDYTSFLPTPTSSETSSDTRRDLVRSHFLEILRNGSCDFDWEVRKLTFGTWMDLAVVAFDGVDQEKAAFIDMLADNCFALILCRGVCDCEYLVKMEAFKCLAFLKDHIKQMFTDNVGNVMEPEKQIRNISDYEDALLPYKDMDRKSFEFFVRGVDFDGVASGLDVLDIKVSSDPVSFIQDVIASAKQSEANLLDCY